MALPYPVASDFYHPKFEGFLQRINNHPFQMHRKLWEWAYVEHQLEVAGMLVRGKAGLCFGVGQEQLPALFASRGCSITATDGSPEDTGAIWQASNEYCRSAKDLNFKGIISEEEFLSSVKFEICDMNSIGSHFRGFDFCWSCCALEHLGSIENGLDFIVDSLNTLQRGGIACHTTEFNLSSNVQTLEEGGTVLYRRKDLEAFVSRVQKMGNEISPLVISPMATPIDHYVDVPPFHHNPHLKLLLEGFVTTSVGITIRKK